MSSPIVGGSSKVRRQIFWRIGAPFLLFMTLGSSFLSTFLIDRYNTKPLHSDPGNDPTIDFQAPNEQKLKSQKLRLDAIETQKQLRKQNQTENSAEKSAEKLLMTIDVNADYENKPVPRPPEEIDSNIASSSVNR